MTFDGPRSAKVEELGEIISLANEIFRPDGGDLGVDHACLLNPENAENIGIIRHAKRPVSALAMLLRDVAVRDCHLKAALLGVVCTHPDYRGKGLAGRLCDWAWNRARECGADYTLVSGDRPLYRRRGCRPVGQRFDYRIPAAGTCPDGLTCRELSQDDIDAVSDLYEARPVRYLRPRSDYEIFFRHGWASNIPATMFGLERAGKLTAYLLISRGEQTEARPVLEYAGSNEDVLTGLPVALTRLKAKAGALQVPWFETRMLKLMEDRGLSGTVNPLGGTVSILNLPPLIARTKSYWVQKAGSDILGKFTVEPGEDSLLIFGAPPPSPITHHPSPLPHPGYGLNHA